MRAIGPSGSGGSRVRTRLTHLERLEFIPAPAHESVAVIRPVHREGKCLLEKGWGALEVLGQEFLPSSLGLAGTPPIIPEAALSALGPLRTLTPGTGGRPSLCLTGSGPGLLELANCSQGSHCVLAHTVGGGGRRRGAPGTWKTDWNSPATPQTCQVLVSLPCPWVFPSFLTVPRVDPGRGTGQGLGGEGQRGGGGWGRRPESLRHESGLWEEEEKEESSKCRQAWPGSPGSPTPGVVLGLAEPPPGHVPRALSLNSPWKLTAVVIRNQGPSAKSFMYFVWLTLEERSLNVSKSQRRKFVLNR